MEAASVGGLFHFKPSVQVAYWHIASYRCAAKFIRYWNNSGQWPAPVLNGSVANDPSATLAVHYGNGFGTGFCPYQSARLDGYDTLP